MHGCVLIIDNQEPELDRAAKDGSLHNIHPHPSVAVAQAEALNGPVLKDRGELDEPA